MRILTAIFSTGWLVPIWLSAHGMFGFLHGEAWPLLLGQHPRNSLDLLQLSEQAFTAGCVWLGLAVLYWAWRLSGPGKRVAGEN